MQGAATVKPAFGEGAYFAARKSLPAATCTYEHVHACKAQLHVFLSMCMYAGRTCIGGRGLSRSSEVNTMVEMMTIKTTKPPNAAAMLPATQPALVHTHPAPASRLVCQCGRSP